MNIINKFKKNYFVEYKLMIYFFGKIISALITLLSIPLFIRWFGEENYGKYVIAYTTFLVFLSAFLGWLNQAVIKYYSNYKNEPDFFYKIENIVFKIAIIGSCILGLTLFFTKQVEVSTLILIILSFIIACFYTNRLIFTQVDYDAKRFVFSEFIRLSSSLIIIFLLKNVFIIDAEKTLFTGILLSFVFGYLYLSKFKLPSSKIFKNNFFDKHIFKNFLIYGFPIGIWMALSPSSNTVDRYVLSSYMGVVAIAQYTAVYDIVFKVFTQLATPIATIIQPMLMNTHNEGNNKEYKKIRNKALLFILVLFLPTITILMVFSDYIIINYLGFKNEDVVKNLKMVILPIALSSLIWQLAILIQRKIEAIGKSYIVTLAMIFVTLISILMSVLFIPKYGYVSLGYIALLVSSLYVFIILIINKKINA